MTNQYLQTRLYTMNEKKTNPKRLIDYKQDHFDKTSRKYLSNPVGHLMALRAFREKLQGKILGEEDAEWRTELEFVLSRTLDKIREIQAKVL